GSGISGGSGSSNHVSSGSGQSRSRSSTNARLLERSRSPAMLDTSTSAGPTGSSEKQSYPIVIVTVARSSIPVLIEPSPHIRPPSSGRPQRPWLGVAPQKDAPGGIV